jgi:hypothetical protein
MLLSDDSRSALAASSMGIPKNLAYLRFPVIAHFNPIRFDFQLSTVFIGLPVESIHLAPPLTSA